MDSLKIDTGFKNILESIDKIDEEDNTVILDDNVKLDTDDIGFNPKKNEWEVIVKYSGDLSQIEQELNAKIEILNDSTAIITLDTPNILKLLDYRQIFYIEQPRKMINMIYKGLLNSCISPVHEDLSLNLTGKGVIVAIIDSGIDYNNEYFINDDGSSRILAIWDQTIEGAPPYNFFIGTEYTNEQINAAIKNKRDPYSIVPHKDTNGHGTAIAGIAGGKGILEGFESKGVAFESSLLIVKVGKVGPESISRTTEIMRAIKYCLLKSDELDMPLVINLSYGTNYGGHDGRTLFEQYINYASSQWKTSIVVASGNEGSSGHHYYNIVNNEQTINVEFTIAGGLNTLFMILWKSFVDDFNFELISPSGLSSGEISFAYPFRTYILDKTKILIYLEQPKPSNIDQEIHFDFYALGGPTQSGIWNLKVTGKKIVEGSFNIWLPVTELVSTKTNFLTPSIFTSLTIPSTAENVITVGGYNSDIINVASFSGRGYTRNNVLVKPDLVAPAVNILAPRVNGGYDVYSGTSIAAPFVSGSAALLMQWGIVNKNDVFLYGERMKAFLREGCIRSGNIDYPNPEWGFGRLCLKNVITNLESYTSFSAQQGLVIDDPYKNTDFQAKNNLADYIEEDLVLGVESDNMANSDNKITINNLENVDLNNDNNINNSTNNSYATSEPYLEEDDINDQQINNIDFVIPTKNIEEDIKILESLKENEFNNTNYITDENYVDFVLEYSPTMKNNIAFDRKAAPEDQRYKNIEFTNVINDTYIMAHVNEKNIEEIKQEYGSELLREFPFVLGLLDKPSLDSTGITAVQNQPYLSLNGSGVLLGFIDTGIDYTNDAFVYEDNTSKIKYIWDQSLPSPIGSKYFFSDDWEDSLFYGAQPYGVEFTQAQINDALASENPYDIVPHVDEVGHGTFLASVAGSLEKGQKIGAAPDSEIIMVKLKKAKKYLREKFLVPAELDEVYQSTDVMLAIEYLYRKAQQLKRPIAICIGLGTNTNGHDGFTFLEEYISIIGQKNGVIINIAAGNENNAKHHFKGILDKVENPIKMEIKTGDKEKGFCLFIWNYSSDKLSFSVSSPTGETFKIDSPKKDEYYSKTLALGNTKIEIIYFYPQLKTGSQVTQITMFTPIPGIWTFYVYGDLILNGIFHAWLPMMNFVDPDTVFLTPNPDYTATVPSTAFGAISLGACNVDGSILSVTSSRGPTRFNVIRPTVVAPGVDVGGVYPYGYGTMSGTSVSAAISTGACALLLEWAIVKGNYKDLNSVQAKSFFIKSAKRKPTLEYPNTQWGYGVLDLVKTIELMSQS